jgi:uncharacterized integral membrane protein
MRKNAKSDTLRRNSATYYFALHVVVLMLILFILFLKISGSNDALNSSGFSIYFSLIKIAAGAGIFFGYVYFSDRVDRAYVGALDEPFIYTNAERFILIGTLPVLLLILVLMTVFVNY